LLKGASLPQGQGRPASQRSPPPAPRKPVHRPAGIAIHDQPPDASRAAAAAGDGSGTAGQTQERGGAASLPAKRRLCIGPDGSTAEGGTEPSQQIAQGFAGPPWH